MTGSLLPRPGTAMHANLVIFGLARSHIAVLLSDYGVFR